jgi:hypothetical protein
VVLIEGEAGIGKSRLVQEYLASAEGGALVACCPPFGRPHTLGPVADAFHQATDGVRGLGLSGLAGALRSLFPEWVAGLPPAPEPTEDATAARHRLFRALAELASCLGVSVIVAEDAHWADEATLEFLLFLASSPAARLGLVITVRPEDVPPGSLLPRLARLAAGSSGLRLALGPLDVGGTAGLVSSMLAADHLSDDFAAFLHEHTGGVPLAVEESVRLMAARADLKRRGGEWVRRELAELPVPPPVRDAVLDRAAPDYRKRWPAGCWPRITAGWCRSGTCWRPGLCTRRSPARTAACCTSGPGRHWRLCHRRRWPRWPGTSVRPGTPAGGCATASRPPTLP